MLTNDVFTRKFGEMKSVLPMRTNSDREADLAVRTYERSLNDLHPEDFIEACDRIIFTDEWFPSIARVRSLAEECGRDRRHRQRKREEQMRERELMSRDGALTCPLCRGARWMRTGRWSQGEAEMEPCGACTTDQRYDARKEATYIARHGGVPVEGTGRFEQADLTAKIAPFRKPNGTLDMDALYRHSRELRGLDPAIDERRAGVAGFMSVGEAGFGQVEQREAAD